MGHTVGKDVYGRLGKKIDNLTMRAPMNKAFHGILKALYSEDEADVIIKMPFVLSKIDRIARITKYSTEALKKILNNLCGKGLVIDLWIDEAYYYMPSPFVIGIFEFTMMRTGKGLDQDGWAKLFTEYMRGDDAFFKANFGDGQRLSLMRTFPHEEAIEQSSYVEILDYEKATTIVESADKLAIGLCSCRHEKTHMNEKECEVPLETCSTFGITAEYLVRNNLAREVSKTEMLENIARSKELGLVLNADNVQKNVTYMCHCCKCCCNVMLGINEFGYDNIVVTSNYIATPDDEQCNGCGKCAKSCPVNAIEMQALETPRKRKKKKPVVDETMCLGCGVCALNCPNQSLELTNRKQRLIHPATTFERVILQCLENGTLQNQIFDNPESLSQKAMRGVMGGFFKLQPVKKALMSDTLRSTFLKTMEIGVKWQGKDYLTTI